MCTCSMPDNIAKGLLDLVSGRYQEETILTFVDSAYLLGTLIHGLKVNDTRENPGGACERSWGSPRQWAAWREREIFDRNRWGHDRLII
jgi:hypothetical protein